LKTKKSISDSSQNETLNSKTDNNDVEVERIFSEIDDFNMAIKHLKNSIFANDDNVIPNQIEKA